MGVKACWKTSRCAARAAARRARARPTASDARRDGRRRVTGGQQRRHAQRLVVFGGDPGRPRRLGPAEARAARREGTDPGRVERGDALDEPIDRGRVRTVARLADGGLPAAGQPLRGSAAEGLGQELVEERAEDQFRGIAVDGIADGRTIGAGRDARRDRDLDGVERRERLGRQEPADRRPERDRWRFGEREPVQVRLGEGRHAFDEPGDRRGGVRPSRRRRRRRPGRRFRGRRPTRPPRATGAIPARPDRVPEPALAVVASAQGRLAQPVVGDIDPLGHLQTVGTGDVRMVAPKQGTPGDLDRLDAGVRRDTEAAIEVIGWQRWAGRHRGNPSGLGDDGSLCSRDSTRRYGPEPWRVVR